VHSFSQNRGGEPIVSQIQAMNARRTERKRREGLCALNNEKSENIGQKTADATAEKELHLPVRHHPQRKETYRAMVKGEKTPLSLSKGGGQNSFRQ